MGQGLEDDKMPLKEMLLMVLVPLMAVLCGCQGMAGGSQADPVVLEHGQGIRIEGIYLSSAGYMLDFRYRVVDPNADIPLLQAEVTPSAVDEKSGAELIVPRPPKVGPLRQKSDRPVLNKVYYVIFANPGGL